MPMRAYLFELCLKIGRSAFIFYNLLKRYSSLDISEAKPMRKLETENSNLKLWWQTKPWIF